jgi:hypothetical protein
MFSHFYHLSGSIVTAADLQSGKEIIDFEIRISCMILLPLITGENSVSKTKSQVTRISSSVTRLPPFFDLKYIFLSRAAV